MRMQEHHPMFTRIVMIFISYVAVLQILYALQHLLISIPFIAVVSTIYILIIQQIISTKKQMQNFLHCTGSNVKTNTTHERDLQNILVQQTERVLQTNLQQFQKVISFRIKFIF